MTQETTPKTAEQATLDKQAIDKFQEEFFKKNKLIFNLTLDQYHAIIGVAAKATIEQGFYVVQDFLSLGDPQKKKLIEEYNKSLEVFKSKKVTKPKLATKRKSA